VLILTTSSKILNLLNWLSGVSMCTYPALVCGCICCVITSIQWGESILRSRSCKHSMQNHQKLVLEMIIYLGFVIVTNAS
jgi:hypothetical protein